MPTKIILIRSIPILIARQKKIPIYQFTPLEAKKSIAGYGRADKSQMQDMVRMLLNLPENADSDASDALALAMTFAHLPNFKRSNINFESELKRAFDSEKNAKDSFWANTRRPSRIQPGVIDYKTVKPRQVLDYLSVEKANGNNVNPEEEAMNVLKVQMQYQLLTMMTSFQYNQVQSVLK